MRSIHSRLALTCLAVTLGSSAVPAQRVEIRLDPSVAREAITGRVYVFLAKSDAREPRLQGGSYGGSVPFFGVDVEGLKPSAATVIDAKTLGYPYESLSQVPAGEYFAQALLNVYTKFTRADGHVIWAHNDQWEGQHFNTSPGNLVSEVRRVRFDPASRTPLTLALTKALPPVQVPADTRWVKRIKIKSEMLSKFWGQPIYVGATVLLPKGFDEEPARKYPAIYIQGHFGLGAPFGFTEEQAGGRGGRGGRGGGGGGGGGGRGDESTGPIIGDPIGADGLKADLEHEMIPYTPAELIAIAEREYAFSLSEIKKAAREMGFGDEWKAAMEKVKNTFVEPGKQPELIRELARQAEEFLDKHDWVTIPPLAREDWRMEMMSPERQRVSPFFLGGEQITVSYPTAEMSDDDKLMSMRGNNPHFSHATVFHELNPGHHLQGFMTARYNAHRRMFSTPFWGEGYALYWEMFLWDHDFHVSPEDRIGALFWRMHRSARIIFSLNFHLGKMTPEQAIQFLVDTVNFERANAEGEVRRSFTGAYSPLYQAGYMLGGLQLRGLYRELVESRRMTVRQFHDAVLQGGPMPIAMVRARLANTPLTRDGAAPWRFADALPPARPRPSP